MRKQRNKLQAVIATIMMLIGLSANAHDFEVDGIYYTITSSEDKTVAVSYQDNINDGYNPSYDYTGDIVIPKQVTYNDIEYSVTSIGYAAFLNCFDLTSVEIPNSVTSMLWYIKHRDSELSYFNRRTCICWLRQLSKY